MLSEIGACLSRRNSILLPSNPPENAPFPYLPLASILPNSSLTFNSVLISCPLLDYLNGALARMESRVLELTKAALRYGNLNIRPCGLDFFPQGILGGPTQSDVGTQIIIQAEGVPQPVKTDIPTRADSGKPRWIFRHRAWVKEFAQVHNLRPGNTVTISRLAKTKYIVYPGNGHKHSSSLTLPRDAIAKPIGPTLLDIPHHRTCQCADNHINCLSAKDWLKCQLGVWQFNYEGRDVRDKKLHPATFPISLARKVIELFTHKGELVLNPFVGSVLLSG